MTDDDDKNDYHLALEAAGAKVLAFDAFGSYQGDWLAKVEYEGEAFWIRDYYGSCSGCDAFEADMPWYSEREGPEYQAKLAEFGKRYLEPSERLTHEQAMKAASENVEWDSSAEEMVSFVKEHA